MPEPSSSSEVATSSDIPSTSSLEVTSSSASPSPTPTPIQAVVNPGFEDATQAPWVLFPGNYQFVNTGDPQYGVKTPRVARGQGLFASIRQIPSFPAGNYAIRFDIKVEGNEPERCTIQLTGIANIAYGRAVDQNWHTYTYSLTSNGNDNQFIRIVVSCDAYPQSGWVYFDNIYIDTST